MLKTPAVIAWSGGKDSALALREVLRAGQHEVVALVTTCTEGFRRISMHGVRCSLLKAQERALQIESRKVFVSQKCSNAEYEEKMKAAFLQFKTAGVNQVIFGDLFLSDIREYREAMLASIGMTSVFPLWGRNTAELAREFIRDRFHAVVVCAAPGSENLAGRIFDEDFLKSLPPHIDPCGENGEFHTFVFDGPIFREPIRYRNGPMVCRDTFTFADLLPTTAKRSPRNV